MKKLKLKNIQAFFIDFDGVLTNNYVYIDENNVEFVRCSRADGLALNFLNKNKIKVFIISSEKNAVVKNRANKLKVKAYYNIKNKSTKALEISKKEKIDLSHCIYIGNDVNDYEVMQLFNYRCCPLDAHKEIKKISNIHLKSKGGDGVIRELLEEKFNQSLL